MTYHCDNCKAVLPTGATSCPGCGRKYDSPVPGDQAGKDQPKEQSVEDLLRARTAGGTSRMDAPTGNASPAWYGTPRPVRKRVPLWLSVSAGVAGAVAVLALIGWGADTVWMRGAGGDIAFRQHNFAGNTAAERGDFQTADDEYSQMIALRPHRDDGYLLRAITEFKAGRLSASIDDNTAALGLTQEPAVRGSLFYNRGQAYAKQGKPVRAISDYSQSMGEYARERNPRMVQEVPGWLADNSRQRADAYWQHKDFALAISDSSRAIAFGSARPEDYGVRGKAESALGRYAAAQADLIQAVTLDPTYMDGYAGLGDLAEKRHQPAMAVAVFQRAIQSDPRSVQFWGSLGWFQYENGQLAQAIESDQHARSLDVGQTWVNCNLALIYAVQGHGPLSQVAYADALRHFGPADRKPVLADIRHALIKQPGSAALRQALALVERGDGAGSSGGGQATVERLPVLRLPAPAKAPAAPAEFASRLGPEVTVGGYGIQPPLGYTLTQHPQVSLTSSGTVYLWSGSVRADGTVPTLQVVIAEDDGTLAAHSTSLQNAQREVDAMHQNHTQFTETPAAAHPINGLPFAQGSWDGIGQRTGKEYRGSEYWLVSPSSIIHLSVHDAAPYSQVTLPLVGASISTFRKL